MFTVVYLLVVESLSSIDHLVSKNKRGSKVFFAISLKQIPVSVIL